jgi:endo-alpha-1,4-polygalactosaminidase (GH114 family)
LILRSSAKAVDEPKTPRNCDFSNQISIYKSPRYHFFEGKVPEEIFDLIHSISHAPSLTMSPSFIDPALVKDPNKRMPPTRSFFSVRSKRLWIIIGAVLIIIAVALGVGLGVGLDSGGNDGSSTTPLPTPSNNTNATTGTFWRPTAGASWQIVLQYALNDTSTNASVYDIDLFTNSASTISALHAQNRSVICYFSAGSYEDFRPDSSQFTSSDKGKELDGWPGEYWLNTKSRNVRKIMSARLALAASKGCDGVDPDNVDAYDNTNGLGLTTADAVDYLTFLAIGAHSLNMSLGLKNGGTIVNATIDMMQWEVNEQCVEYTECALFQPFIAAGKPVFHIEYPKDAPSISTTQKTSICGDKSAAGFSTVLKDLDLDNWIETC